MNGAVVRRGSIVGAGAVVTRPIPDYAVAVGVPARVVRELTDEEIERSRTFATHYVARAWAFLAASEGG